MLFTRSISMMSKKSSKYSPHFFKSMVMLFTLPEAVLLNVIPAMRAMLLLFIFSNINIKNLKRGERGPCRVTGWQRHGALEDLRGLLDFIFNHSWDMKPFSLVNREQFGSALIKIMSFFENINNKFGV